MAALCEPVGDGTEIICVDPKKIHKLGIPQGLTLVSVEQFTAVGHGLFFLLSGESCGGGAANEAGGTGCH